VSIDDQPGVYHTLPIAQFVDPSRASSALIENKSIRSRLESDDQAEIRLICRYWLNKVDNIEAEMTAIHKNSRRPPPRHVTAKLIEVLRKTSVQVTTPTIDLFCIETLFSSAIASAQRAVANTSGPVAWGNTNTRPTDYRDILRNTHRPVHFVVWKRDLPDCSFATLLERSLRRCAATGRYVPAGVIWDMMQRTEQLVKTEMSLDAHLASLAGFHWDPDTRRVRPIKRGLNDDHRDRRGRHTAGRGRKNQ